MSNQKTSTVESQTVRVRFVGRRFVGRRSVGRRSVGQRCVTLLTLLILLTGFSAVGWAQESPGQLSPGQNPGGITNDAIDRVGDDVMNASDFRSVRRQILEQRTAEEVDRGFLRSTLSSMADGLGSVFTAIGNFFRWLLSGSGRPANPGIPTPPPVSAPSSSSSWDFSMPDFSVVVKFLAFLGIVAVVIVLIAMIVKTIDSKKRKTVGLLDESNEMLADITTPPGELAASTYEGRALQMAREGNYRAAIRELLLGSMSWIERAGLIRYRKGLTNRDYVRSVWRRMEKREAYLVTATQFEYVFFGRRKPTAEMFEQCLTSFRGAFREEEIPTASV